MIAGDHMENANIARDVRLLQTYQLTVLTTNNCTAACAHCCMSSEPRRTGQLTFDQIRRYVDEALEAAPLQLLIFAGGEPLLLGPHLYRSLEHAAERGLATRLVTNASWAVTPSRAQRVARRLFEAGLTELNISIDDYHLPYVSPMRVKHAFDAARCLPFLAVVLIHAVGPQTRFNGEDLDQLIGESLPRLYTEEGVRCPTEPGPDRPFLAVSNTTAQAVGRAATAMADGEFYIDTAWERRAREIGGCPWAVRSPAISPDGHLVSCCGFEATGNEILDIGDLAEAAVGALLDRADDSLALNAIATVGPYRIMDHLRVVEPDLPFAKAHSGICAVCQDLVSNPSIRDAFIQHLPDFVPAVLASRRTLRAQASPRERESDVERAPDDSAAEVDHD
jgi:hypothetical protein